MCVHLSFLVAASKISIASLIYILFEILDAATSRLYLGCTSAVSRLYLGCASAVPSAVSRLYFDYIYLGCIYLGYSSAITSAVPRLFLGGSSHRAMSQRHGGQQPPPDRSVAASEAVPCSLAPQIARAEEKVFCAGFWGAAPNPGLAVCVLPLAPLSPGCRGHAAAHARSTPPARRGARPRVGAGCLPPRRLSTLRSRSGGFAAAAGRDDGIALRLYVTRHPHMITSRLVRRGLVAPPLLLARRVAGPPSSESPQAPQRPRPSPPAPPLRSPRPLPSSRPGSRHGVCERWRRLVAGARQGGAGLDGRGHPAPSPPSRRYQCHT